MKETTGTVATTTATKRIRANGQEVAHLENGTSTLYTTTDAGTSEQSFAHKSDLFKHLFDNGMAVGDIAAICKSHYSFVYGVIKNSGRVLEGKSKESKSDLIREMADRGMTPGQIAKETNSNYSFVHSVVKTYKAAKLAKAI